MGSTIQVEQIIGRVIRQPGAKHHPDLDLNTAHFYIRIGAKQEFPQILETVRRKIAAEYPEVKLDGYSDRKERERTRRDPRVELTVPQIHIDLEEAIKFRGSTAEGPFIDAIKQIIDYRGDTTNTTGRGERMRAVQPIGDGSKAPIETTQLHHSNRVMARWIVKRTVQTRYPPAAQSVDWSDGRFDARVEITSRAAQSLRESAENLVRVYLEHAKLAFEEGNLYTVGPVIVNPKKFEPFNNAIHEGYSDLNALELQFAKAIDETGLRWARNKGDHLIDVDAGRKLLTIRDERSKQKVIVRLFTEGKWVDTKTKTSEEGYTVWSVKSGLVKPRHVPTVEKAVEAALKV
jgi:type III restriction enzyme